MGDPWWFILYVVISNGDLLLFWAVGGLFDTDFFFWRFWLSFFYCFSRSIVSGDLSSIQNFFFHNHNIICYTNTTTEIYDSSSCYWHDTNYIIYVLYLISFYSRRWSRRTVHDISAFSITTILTISVSTLWVFSTISKTLPVWYYFIILLLCVYCWKHFLNF